MWQRVATMALTIASWIGVVGGAVWLVMLARADDAHSVTVRLGSGETLTIEYDAFDPHEFTRDERAAIAEVAARAIPDVHRALLAMPVAIQLHVGSTSRDRAIPETGENNHAATGQLATPANRRAMLARIARDLTSRNGAVLPE